MAEAGTVLICTYGERQVGTEELQPNSFLQLRRPVCDQRDQL
jgi:hypothetical protein